MSNATVIALACFVGLPCALLALAIIYRAHVASRMPAAYDGWEPDIDDFAGVAPAPAYELAAVALEPDPALVALQETVRDVQEQLQRQRVALTELLSDRERQRELAVAGPRPLAALVDADDDDDLHVAVQRLIAEGLSERAIARRLRIGLEEVRLAGRRERAS
jgi:hypothetical protein